MKITRANLELSVFLLLPVGIKLSDLLCVDKPSLSRALVSLLLSDESDSSTFGCAGYLLIIALVVRFLNPLVHVSLGKSLNSIVALGVV